jgi:hypothetical protein
MAGKNIPDELKFDTRTLDNKLRNGKIDKAEYKEYLKNLPDESANVDYLEVGDDVFNDEPTPFVEPTFTSA